MGLAFLVAYHLLSRGLAGLPRRARIGLVALQVGCAVALLQLITSNATGPLLLLFALAVELQFLVPLRGALLGTAGLWVLGLVTLELLRLHDRSSVLRLQQLLTDSGSMLAGFIFVVAFTRSAVNELVQRHQTTILLDELHAAHAQLQTYVARVEELGAARERNRLAREIHDTLGHYLTIVNVQLEAAQKLGMRDAARSQVALATAKQLAGECLAEVRRSVAALRPVALEDGALPEAIARLVDDLQRAADITVQVEGQGGGRLAAAVEEVVYRVVQEALTNVRKHAQAEHVWLRTEWGPDTLTVSVRDDGRGALLDGGTPPGSGFGLRGMQERAAAVGGSLTVTTAPGSGFSVLLQVPCASPASGALPEVRPALEVSGR